ncbi:cardiolipin synthase [Polystyrenella longa]|uniref:cardiolipin synthase n=1 Tax=Polystyrenella longa TaxID=2528007 RepID=UPI00119E1B45|nr:cardiolipin synthase [Polystyrenella longa]
MNWYLLYLISEWVLRIMMIPVVTHRRRPNSAMAWLLIIFFEPWFGFLIYVLIGENRLPQRRIRKHDRLLAKLETLSRRFRDHPQVMKPDYDSRLQSAIDLAERLGYMPILGNNSVELLAETDETINRLIADIDQAQKHVHMLFYIYRDDKTGNKVNDALARAVARGVKCRLLLDAVGSSDFLKHNQQELIDAGIEVHAALPVQFFRRKAARIDLRNHRKIVVIDGSISYTGSQNIVDSDYGLKKLAWHDLMIRMEGPVTIELQAVFLTDWYFETDDILEGTDIFPDPKSAGSTPIQTLPSGPSYPTENHQRMVLSMLHAAQHQVTITSPYFIPDEALLQAIEVAVLRGVEVTLILPEKSDQVIVGAAARGYYGVLLEMGAHIYLYQPGLLHAKTITIDSSICMIGSSNFDIRSFELNFELTMMLYGKPINMELKELQDKYLSLSEKLELSRWNRRPYYQRLFQNVMRLFSPLL